MTTYISGKAFFRNNPLGKKHILTSRATHTIVNFVLDALQCSII